MDRVDWFFRQKVTEAEFDDSQDKIEQADRNFAVDINLFGVLTDMVVSQHAPTADLTVDAAGPASAYDQQGRRIAFSSLQNIDVSQDSNAVSTAVGSGGNEKIVSVFIEFDRNLSDPRTDGNSLTVFFIRDESFQFIVEQGAEAGAGTAIPPPLKSDAILLTDIVMTFGMTQVLGSSAPVPGTGDFESSRRQDGAGVGDQPAETVLYDGGPNWADGTTNPAANLNVQLDKMITDLAGTTGAAKIGTSATAGSPNALAAGETESQLDELLGHLNDHENDTVDAHGASAVSYAGGGSWADGTTNPATTAEAQLDKIISDLSIGDGTGKSRFPGDTGNSALSSAPNFNIAGNNLTTALGLILDEINKRAARAGDTFFGNVVPDITGTKNLGSSGVRWAFVYSNNFFGSSLQIDDGFTGPTIINGIRKVTITKDIGSIPANSTLDETFSPGAAIGFTISFEVLSVIPSVDLPSGVGIVSARVSATDVITVRFMNTTAGAVDPGSITYVFWIID